MLLHSPPDDQLLTNIMQTSTLQTQLEIMFSLPFEVFFHAPKSGAENMLWDTSYAQELLQNTTYPASFRLYSWQPWCVSLGYHQEETDIDTRACRERGWDIVRRPTGGKAVLHAEELTYSLIMPLTTINQHEAYQRSHEFLRSILCRVLPAKEHEYVQYTASNASFAHEYKTSASSALCFARSAQYEISWHGRKLIGSAQRIYQGTQAVLLQHGSIPLTQAHTRLPEVLVMPPHKQETLRTVLANKSVSLSEIADRMMSINDIFRLD
jgi:lipoate-protein ligase A